MINTSNNQYNPLMKAGIVCLIGRPNVGKSTLLNNLLDRKVAITSPKPQTTRFVIEAVYEDERGQIIFLDTPGIFGRVHDELARKINARTEDAAIQPIDIVIYIVDHTRERDFEENRALGLVRKIPTPNKILVINKSDIKHPTHIVQYKFMEEEFTAVIKVSALKRQNLNQLLNTIFSLLPEREKLLETNSLIQPGLNLDSNTFIAELIREKAFLFLRSELPYSLTAVVDEKIERESGSLYIKARLLTNSERYKAMIIGKNGSMIKEIGMATRKELETATNKKIFLELTVEVDKDWQNYL